MDLRLGLDPKNVSDKTQKNAEEYINQLLTKDYSRFHVSKNPKSTAQWRKKNVSSQWFQKPRTSVEQK